MKRRSPNRKSPERRHDDSLSPLEDESEVERVEMELAKLLTQIEEGPKYDDPRAFGSMEQAGNSFENSNSFGNGCNLPDVAAFLAQTAMDHSPKQTRPSKKSPHKSLSLKSSPFKSPTLHSQDGTRPQERSSGSYSSSSSQAVPSKLKTSPTRRSSEVRAQAQCDVRPKASPHDTRPEEYNASSELRGRPMHEAKRSQVFANPKPKLKPIISSAGNPVLSGFPNEVFRAKVPPESRSQSSTQNTAPYPETGSRGKSNGVRFSEAESTPRNGGDSTSRPQARGSVPIETEISQPRSNTKSEKPIPSPNRAEKPIPSPTRTEVPNEVFRGPSKKSPENKKSPKRAKKTMNSGEKTRMSAEEILQSLEAGMGEPASSSRRKAEPSTQSRTERSSSSSSSRGSPNKLLNRGSPNKNQGSSGARGSSEKGSPNKGSSNKSRTPRLSHSEEATNPAHQISDEHARLLDKLIVSNSSVSNPKAAGAATAHKIHLSANLPGPPFLFLPEKKDAKENYNTIIGNQTGLLDLLPVFYPGNSKENTEKQNVRILAQNLVLRKSSNHRYPLEWLSTIVARKKPPAIHAEQFEQMNEVEDLYYKLQKLDDSSKKTESYHGLLEGDGVQVRGLLNEIALNGQTARVQAILHDKKPCKVEIIPNQIANFGYEVGNLIMLYADRIAAMSAQRYRSVATAQMSEADLRAKMFHGMVGRLTIEQIERLQKFNGCIARLENIPENPLSLWECKVVGIGHHGSMELEAEINRYQVSNDYKQLQVHVAPSLIAKFVCQGDYIKITNFEKEPRYIGTLAKVNQHNVDGAGRDLLSCQVVKLSDVTGNMAHDGGGYTKEGAKVAEAFKCFPKNCVFHPKVGDIVWVRDESRIEGRMQRATRFSRGKVINMNARSEYVQVQILDVGTVSAPTRVAELADIQRYDKHSDPSVIEKPVVVSCITENLVPGELHVGDSVTIQNIPEEAKGETNKNLDPALNNCTGRIIHESPPGTFLVQPDFSSRLKKKDGSYVETVTLTPQYLRKQVGRTHMLEGDYVVVKGFSEEHDGKTARICHLRDECLIDIKLEKSGERRSIPSSNLARIDQQVMILDELHPAEKFKVLEAEAVELVSLYHKQLDELVACQTLLQADQERFAELLAQKWEPGIFTDEKSDLATLKQGLEFRVCELEEDCRRVSKTERHLNRVLFNAVQEYEISLLCSTGLVSDRLLLKRMRQHQKVIDSQQELLDWLRFQRDIAEDDVRRLRKDAYSGHVPGIETIQIQPGIDVPSGLARPTDLERLKAPKRPKEEDDVCPPVGGPSTSGEPPPPGEFDFFVASTAGPTGPEGFFKFFGGSSKPALSASMEVGEIDFRATQVMQTQGLDSFDFL